MLRAVEPQHSAVQLATVPRLESFDRSLHEVRSVTPQLGDNQRLTLRQWQALSSQLDAVIAAQRKLGQVDATAADPLLTAFKDLGATWGLGLPLLQPKLRVFHEVLAGTIAASERNLQQRLKTLQLFQWAALAAGALLLIGLLTQLARNSVRAERAVAIPQQGTQHILSTVTEGLFLLDRNLVIGVEFSNVTTEILRRTELAGLSLEELLKDMVPTRTLTLAIDFIKLLWSDHVEPELIDEITSPGRDPRID